MASKLSVEEIAARKGGSSVEDSTHLNKQGVYVHPESGVRIVARNHGKFGSAQADAFVRVGFVLERPATSSELINGVFAGTRDQLDEETEETPEVVVEKPLVKMNSTQLTAKALELGVELPEDSTNKEKAKLIQDKLDESK